MHGKNFGNQMGINAVMDDVMNEFLLLIKLLFLLHLQEKTHTNLINMYKQHAHKTQSDLKCFHVFNF